MTILLCIYLLMRFIFLLLNSKIDFQSIRFGATWKSIVNLIITLLTNINLMAYNYCFGPQTKYLYKKTKSLWTWFWSYRINVSSCFCIVFLVAVTFLFDLETALLLPLPGASHANCLKTMLTVALFLILLLAINLA